MKEKLQKGIYWFMKNNGMTAVVATIIMIGIMIYFKINHIQDVEVFDFTIFFSILIAMILEVVAVLLSKFIMNLLEDTVKLDTNYEKLSSRYMGELITYDNNDAASENKNIFYKKNKENKKLMVRFPVVEDFKLYKETDSFYPMRIEDLEDMYEPPEDIRENFEELFSVHGTSNIYNQLNIRVNDWHVTENVFVLHTSRTTYFHSMVTNRSMDVRWKNGLTTRDVYEYGPFLPELKEEVLSNHLGFNGFVESKDGYIPFIKRNRVVSIGKSTYGNSVGASLKTRYALNEKREFTLEGLRNGMLKEIKDELKLSEDQLEDFSLQGNVITAYRDMVEGGKPQFLFWAKSKLNHKEIEVQFQSELQKKKKQQKARKWDTQLKELEDGETFLWIPKASLKEMVILPNEMIYSGKSYATMPSAAAAVVMLIEFLEWKKEL